MRKSEVRHRLAGVLGVCDDGKSFKWMLGRAAAKLDELRERCAALAEDARHLRREALEARGALNSWRAEVLSPLRALFPDALPLETPRDEVERVTVLCKSYQDDLARVDGQRAALASLAGRDRDLPYEELVREVAEAQRHLFHALGREGGRLGLAARAEQVAGLLEEARTQAQRVAEKLEGHAEGGLFAVWGYDLFPYLLGDEVVRLLPDGKAEVRGYGMAVEPLRLLPLAAGKALFAELGALAEDRARSERVSDAEWLDKVHHVAPYLRRA